jgi:uncharacterized glyoxalase superfamily protein PhnB
MTQSIEITQRIVPGLVYDDVAAALTFLEQAFGFAPHSTSRNADGKVMHAEMQYGHELVMLSPTRPQLGLASPKDLPASSAGLLVYVDDVDAHFARARAAGAHIDYEPTNMEYGQREYGARDPEGQRWYFATPTTDASV